MSGSHGRAAWTIALTLLCACSASLADEDRGSAQQAEAILHAANVQGGLVVHLNCGQGNLTAALCANDCTVVQGLDADSSNVTAAREHIRSRGLYGKVSVRYWPNEHLPYGDNLVNLIVTRETGHEIRDEELIRVLAPRGKIIAPAGTRIPHPVSRTADGLVMFTKPVPAEIDEWTHYLHDAGNNAVAEDDRVGPPRHLQWKSGPNWSRSHEFASSVQALVSAHGRLIGVIDEGIIGQPRGVPEFWTLIARDAFNGIQLWRRPCARIPAHALAAVGDRVYVTLQSRGPLSILDAATGQTLHTCEQTGRVTEIAHCEDRLILGTHLAGANGQSGPHVAAADPEDGRLLWKTPAASIATNTLVAGNGRVCYSDGSHLVCLSLDDGRELWRSDSSGRGKGYVVLYDDVVFLTGGSTRAFSLDTGQLLWTGPDGSPHARNPPGLFGAQGLIWTAWDQVDPRSFLWQHREEVRNGYDPKTGEIQKTVTAQRLVTAGHHIRCYPPKATHRYLLLNKRGVEFFDLEGTNHMRANWTRGACGFGMLPANGFLYTPPSQCFCYQGVLLTGLNALAATRQPRVQTVESGPEARLERGPAYDAIRSIEDSTAPASGASTPESGPADDWPTYRHDARRSASTTTSLPVELDRMWSISLCAPAFAEDDPANEKEQGVRLLSAADATIHGEGAKKSGEAIISWRGKDTSISWQTQIDETASLPVWISQSNAGQGGSTFELAVGPHKLQGTIQHTAGWDDYTWFRVGDVEIVEPGAFTVSVKPVTQAEGRLGNVAAVAIGGRRPPAGTAQRPPLREYPRGGLTPPVAADGKVFVAEPDAHMVHAVDAEEGTHLWSYIADGRVDSPPTLYQGLCIFGCTDGHVYCLNAADGQLAWRFRAAPEERQLCIMGQVESAWPVHGSVLVRDGKVYLTAGRSSYLDGGIWVYALDPRTGEILHEQLLRSDEPDVTKYGGRPFDMEGAKSDILVAGQEDIYMFQNRFNPDLTLQPMPRITKLGDRQGEPHLMTNDGFLDKTWFNRTYWTHSDRWPGYYFTYRGPKSGQLLAFDDTATYALKVYTQRRGHSPEFTPGTGYQLVADRNTTKPVLDEMDIGAEKGRGFMRTELPIWETPVPIRAFGMLLAREHMYVVGPPDLTPEQGAYEAMIGKRGSIFRVVYTSDGSQLAEFKMDEVPVFDGLIAADKRLYLSTMDGTVICLGEKE